MVVSGGVACARVRSKLFMKDQKRKVHMAHKLSTKLNDHKEQTAYTAEKRKLTETPPKGKK